MVHEEDGFLEFLELQEGSDLVTKSALLNNVRNAGFKLSDRQLTFYMSEGLIPLSVRAGSRAGVYPRVVVDLMIWILQLRRIGVSIDVLRELLPIWKLLMRSAKQRVISLGEIELVAQQHVSSSAALGAAPTAVSLILNSFCKHCRERIRVIDRDGHEQSLAEMDSVGFAVASRLDSGGDDNDHAPEDKWVAGARIPLLMPRPNEDPTFVRLGRRANEPWPADDEWGDRGTRHARQSERNEEVTSS